MQQRLPSLLDSPIAFAHRGASAHARENTLDAFALALRLGATGLETDIWMTRDGEVVLDHDGEVKRRLGKSRISQVDRADLPPHIPTLRQLFSQCGNRFELSIDVKDEACFSAIVSVARECGFPVEQLWLCHPHLEVLLRHRDAVGDARLVDSTRLARIKEGFEMRVAKLAREGIHVVNMHHTDWNGGLVTMAHKFGVYAFGWDMQQPPVLANSLRMGLDAVYSDHVDRMMDAYREQIV